MSIPNAAVAVTRWEFPSTSVKYFKTCSFLFDVCTLALYIKTLHTPWSSDYTFLLSTLLLLYSLAEVHKSSSIYYINTKEPNPLSFRLHSTSSNSTHIFLPSFFNHYNPIFLYKIHAIILCPIYNSPWNFFPPSIRSSSPLSLFFQITVQNILHIPTNC